MNGGFRDMNMMNPVQLGDLMLIEVFLSCCSAYQTIYGIDSVGKIRWKVKRVVGACKMRAHLSVLDFHCIPFVPHVVVGIEARWRIWCFVPETADEMVLAGAVEDPINEFIHNTSPIAMSGEERHTSRPVPRR